MIANPNNHSEIIKYIFRFGFWEILVAENIAKFKQDKDSKNSNKYLGSLNEKKILCRRKNNKNVKIDNMIVLLLFIY